MTMEEVQATLQERIAKLLESGEVTTFLAWENGRFPRQTTPLVLSDAAGASKVAWNEYCVNTLSKYTRDLAYRGRVGIVVRGCDARGVIRLINDKEISRDDVYLLGVGCPGMKDMEGNPLKKCTQCRHQNPPVYDEFIGDPVEDHVPENRFAEVEAVEAMSQQERAAYFERVYSKCIRCYACRDVCPCCTCRECFVDARRENWVGKQNNLPENRFYGITRVMHIGDRCIECGECERVCPMDLPLMTMNRKVIRDMNELFGEFEAGMEIGEPTEKLMTYNTNDPEEFM
ncbi:MAG: 4Fe-4S dicluster domain-containing protein [Coriobacteriia bacterium]|nr:4Fe-4S dicluster domain-containing protein [Coriobacteriia bacterium]